MRGTRHRQDTIGLHQATLTPSVPGGAGGRPSFNTSNPPSATLPASVQPAGEELLNVFGLNAETEAVEIYTTAGITAEVGRTLVVLDTRHYVVRKVWRWRHHTRMLAVREGGS